MSMLKEKAVVISYEAGIAQVRFQPVKSCSGCGEQQGCGVSALSALTGEPTHCIFSVPSLMPLKAGQQVEIGLPERSLFVSIFLAICSSFNSAVSQYNIERKIGYY